MVDGVAVFQADDETGGHARFAGVGGLDHGHRDAPVGHGAADIEADAVQDLAVRKPLGLEFGGQFHDAAQGGPGAFAYFQGLTHMVAMIVRDQDQIGLDVLGCGLGRGVSVEPGVDQD